MWAAFHPNRCCKNADVAHTLRERGKEFGFSFDNLNLDFSVAVKRSRQVSDRLVRGVGFLMKKNNIDVHMGTARDQGQRYRSGDRPGWQDRPT